MSASGVQGALHTTGAGVGEHVSFSDVMGCTASADGDTLSCLANDTSTRGAVEVVTLRAGSSTVSTTPIAAAQGDFLATVSRLLYWPTPAPRSPAAQ